MSEDAVFWFAVLGGATGAVLGIVLIEWIDRIQRRLYQTEDILRGLREPTWIERRKP